jgi:hypothetical protein
LQKELENNEAQSQVLPIKTAESDQFYLYHNWNFEQRPRWQCCGWRGTLKKVIKEWTAGPLTRSPRHKASHYPQWKQFRAIAPVTNYTSARIRSRDVLAHIDSGTRSRRDRVRDQVWALVMESDAIGIW